MASSWLGLRCCWCCFGDCCSGSTLRRYLDGLAAVCLFVIAQLLVCGLQHVTAKINHFPAPIIAMLFVAVIMMGLSWVMEGVDSFYQKYLRRPTDLLNRHMSIGFTVPFTMILNGPSPTTREVGLMVSGFLVTGILNTGLVYAAARGLQALVRPSPRKNLSCQLVREGTPEPPGLLVRQCECPLARPQLYSGRLVRKICGSQISTITNNTSLHEQSDAEREMQTSPEVQEQEPEAPPRTSGGGGGGGCGNRTLTFLRCNPVLWLSLLAIPLLGLPIALMTGNDTPFDTFLLLFLWTGTLAAQSAVRSAGALSAHHPRTHAFATTALNAVLWTSLGMIGYVVAKAAVKHTSPAAVLDSFATGATLADLVGGSGSGGGGSSSSSSSSSLPPPPSLGAGDVAISVLNAGIVAWGLKLFECRAQLVSRAGLCALAVAGTAALANVACGPLLVHAMGLGPAARALAFAARSVTLALAGPAMASLGGDVGLNAAMVVFNGIVFQMGMGIGVARWAEAAAAATAAAAAPGAWLRWRQGGGGGGAGVEPRAAAADDDVEKMAAAVAAAEASRERPARDNDVPRADDNDDDDDAGETYDDARIVGTGVAVGINAAAMGTAYLYEDGSRAAPYSALAMTMFGVMTVVFTSIRPLASWLVAEVSQ